MTTSPHVNSVYSVGSGNTWIKVRDWYVFFHVIDAICDVEAPHMSSGVVGIKVFALPGN